jgi:hypothetical protein
VFRDLNPAQRGAQWPFVMGRLKQIVLLLSVGWLLASEPSAMANPIGDFFKRVGNSIAHPRQSPTPRPSKRNTPAGNKRKAASLDAPPTELGIPSAPAPTPTPTPMHQPMPVPLVVRSAAGAPPSKARRDLPYGIPVPGKPGFVTSPFAPKSGYVDVRGFPSGTEVKDPYTAKIFLTP